MTINHDQFSNTIDRVIVLRTKAYVITTKRAEKLFVFIIAYHYLTIEQMTVNHDQFSNKIDRVVLRTKT